MKRKNDIDLEVATDLAMTKRSVAQVTTAFVEQLRRTLVEEGAVNIDGLGRFKTRVVIGGNRASVLLTKGNFKKGERGSNLIVAIPYRLWVDFKRALPLKRLMQEYYKRTKENDHGQARRR